MGGSFFPNGTGKWLDAPTGATGGDSVGSAVGIIRIDTQSIARDRAVVVREAQLAGRGIERGLGDGAEAGARRASQAFAQLQRSIGTVLAAVTGFGVASAQSVKSLEARFRLLAGSEEAATEQLDMLREMAEKTGQPFLKVVEGATALMPALRGGNAELDKTLLLTQRLAIIDPVQGVEGAAFAIREFLNGEYLSLVRRLELDRNRLKQIRDEAQGDQSKMIAGLSAYIDEMGVTDQALYDMGQTGVQAFAVLRSEATETAADVFEPFLNDVLIPMVQAFSDLMRELRDVNPELKKFVGIAAGVGGIAAAGSNGLPIVGKIPGGGAVARAAGVGLAGYGGLQAGAYVARQVSPELKDKSQQETIDLFIERFKQMIVIAADTWNKLDLIVRTGYTYLENGFGVITAAFELGAAHIGNALATLVDAIGDGAAAILDGFAKFLEGLEFSESVDLGFTTLKIGVDFGSLPDDLKEAAEGARHLDDSLRTSDETMQRFHDRMERGTDLTDKQREAIVNNYEAGQDNVRMLGEWLGVIEETSSAGEILASGLGRVRDIFGQVAEQARAAVAANSQELNISDELLAEWETLQEDLAQLEAEYNADTEAELAAHEERKASIIADYQARVERIVEDAQIAYERALQNAQDKEAEIRQGVIDTIAESNQELAETLAEINEEYRETEAQAARDHLDRLAKIQADGKRSELTAAGKLDALGLLEAQIATNQKLKQEKDSFAKERDQRRKRYEDALDDAQEAHDDQIEAAKENAQEQIKLLWERFDKEERMRQQDTQRRLNQLRKEHNDRMAELQRQHDQRMAELQRDYGQERSAMLTHFSQTLMDQNQHLGNLREIEQQHREQLEQDLRDWWAANAHLYMPPTPVGAPPVSGVTAPVGVGVQPAEFASGGRVPMTGLAKLHAGEHVLNPETTRTLSRMLGEPLTQAGLIGAMARGGAGGGSFTIENMPIMFPQTDRQWTRFEIEQLIEKKVSAAVAGIA